MPQTEKVASLLVLLTVAVLVCSCQQLYITEKAAVFMNLCAIFQLDFLQIKKIHMDSILDWKLRPSSTAGLYSGCLVPTAIIMSTIAHQSWQHEVYHKLQIICAISLLSTTSLIWMVLSLQPYTTRETEQRFTSEKNDSTNYSYKQISPKHSSQLNKRSVIPHVESERQQHHLAIFGRVFCSVFLLVGGATLFLCHQHDLDCLCFWAVLVGCMTLSVLLLILPKLLPYSLSIGEASVCCHGVTYFLFSFCCQVLHKAGLLLPSSQYASGISKQTYFVEVAMVSCILVVTIVATFKKAQNVWVFCALVPTVIVVFSLPILLYLINDNFVVWTYRYVLQNPTRLKLFSYWASLCFLVAVIIYRYAGHVDCGENKCVDEKRGKQKLLLKKKSVWRKQFHVLGVLAFIPGLMYDGGIMFMAASCCLVVFIMLECVRLVGVWPVAEPLHRAFNLFTDERDQGPVIMTHLYLITGCSMPLWLQPQLTGRAIGLYSGILCLGVGDTAASLVGTYFGNLRWPGSRKTLEGTAACILSQLLTLVILRVTGATYHLGGLIAPTGVVLASLLEAFTCQIDNLILPLYLFMMLVR